MTFTVHRVTTCIFSTAWSNKLQQLEPKCCKLSLPSPAIRKLWYCVKLPPAVKWCRAMQGYVGYEEQCIRKRTIPSPKVGSGSSGCWLSEGCSIYTEVPRSFPDVPWSKQTYVSCDIMQYLPCSKTPYFLVTTLFSTLHLLTQCIQVVNVHYINYSQSHD